MHKVYTFGGFDIKKQDKSILSNANYPYKLIRLFKYFLTFKGKKLIPERIVEDLWDDEEFLEPKNVLRTQISRLRRGISKRNHEIFFEILFSYGYYTFHLDNEKATVDVDIFEKAIEKANSLKEEFPEKAIEAYEEAVSIYKGEYLSESGYEQWLIPIRNRYERLYLQSIFELIKLLIKFENYVKIVEICEEAMNLVALNEKLNIYFLEALININQKKYALSHYEYITSKLYREMNSPPSDEMKMIYKRLKGE